MSKWVYLPNSGLHPFTNLPNYAITGLMILLLLTFVTMTLPSRSITVDPGVQYQTFRGWGTSLAWWAHVVGGFPEPIRSEYMDWAFDPVKGLGLTVVRYNIGGGENPQYLAPNKQFMEYRCAVPGYEPSPGQWDWSADANQRWVLREAIRRGANRLEAFSNSPPFWMTHSGSVTGNQGGADNLKPDSFDTFADYLATVVKHFHDAWGITFQTLEPLNEPSGGWWRFGGRQEGCHFSRPNQNVMVRAAGEALARLGLRTTVSASDENTIADADRTFPYYDSTALGYLNRINTHSYGGGDRRQLADYARNAGKDLWLSEYGDGDASGLTMSRRILEDMNGLHPTAWVYWQVVDNAGGWGMLLNPMKDETTTAYVVNKKYWVMANYSRFIRPGCRLISIDDPNSLAAYDTRSRTLVIVTTNSGDQEAHVSYDLSRFSRLGAEAVAYRTSPSQDLAKLEPVRLRDRRLESTLPPKSVTTYVVHDTFARR